VVTLVEYYRTFAEVEARGVSPIYEAWALGVAADPEVLTLLETLPGLKAQANLVFAAARWRGCPLGEYEEFRRWLLANWSITRATVLARSTQTNEAGRCAVLLPELASIDGPIALLEVGASAGLCLYPDRYSYRYEQNGIVTALDPVAGVSPVVLRCVASDGTPLPERLPEVVWRAGIDTHPIDIGDAAEEKWLEMFIWPGQPERLPTLRNAAAIATAEPPLLVEGDLLDSLHSAIGLAPTDATLVIFHSAALVYLTPDRRSSFVDAVRRTRFTWLSIEGGSIFPEITDQIPASTNRGGRFILSRNGVAVALTGPHGQSLERVPL
jgi:hypothetical protein